MLTANSQAVITCHVGSPQKGTIPEIVQSVHLLVRPLLLVLLCAACPAPGLAQVSDPHEAQPERPSVATHAGTVAPGWVEIEAGAEIDRYADRSQGGSIPMVFKLGLAPRLQLTVQTPTVRPPHQTTTGFGDVSARVKWRLVDGAPVVGDFALLPSIKFPSGSANSGTGTGTTDFGVVFISSHAFGSVAMDLNVGYGRRSGDGTNASRNFTVWAVAFGGPAHKSFGWSAELFSYPGTSGPRGTRRTVALLAGPTWQVRKWLVLDAGFIAPIAGPQFRAIYVGATYNVGKLGN